MTEPTGPVPMVVRGARRVHNAFFWFKAIVWTLFALGGPLVFLKMHNYLGVTITGAIGVLIGGLLYGPTQVQSALRPALRVALCGQGLVLGSYGALKLAQSPRPWVHEAASLEGSEVSSLVVDFERRLAFAGTGSGIFRRSF